MTNPLPDWYRKRYLVDEALIALDYRTEIRRAGASISGPHLECGAAGVRGAATPFLVNLGERLKLAKQAEEGARELRAAPWPLRLELWWLRQRLRWPTRPGFRLIVQVPTV